MVSEPSSAVDRCETDVDGRGASGYCGARMDESVVRFLVLINRKIALPETNDQTDLEDRQILQQRGTEYILKYRGDASPFLL